MVRGGNPGEQAERQASCIVEAPGWTQCLAGVVAFCAFLLVVASGVGSKRDALFALAAVAAAVVLHEPFHWAALWLAGHPARISVHVALPPKAYAFSPSRLGRGIFRCYLAAPLFLVPLLAGCWFLLGSWTWLSLAGTVVMAVSLWAKDGYWLFKTFGFPRSALFLDHGPFFEVTTPG